MKRDLIVTAPEAAKMLGISSVKVVDLINKGKLPALRIGGSKREHYRIRLEDINRLFTVEVKK